ncbi:MAG: DUF924 family protein [Porticoccaceae bacterium]
MDGSGLPAWQCVLDYWFGSAMDDGVCAQQHSSLWWGKAPETDADIRQRFEVLLQVLVNGGNRYWLQFPESRLAAIIVLDQFSRNIYRDTPTSFAADRLALNWSLSGISAGLDMQLRPIQRVFFYLPLEHAEDPAVQQRSVSLFSQLLGLVPEGQRDLFSGFLDFAERHAAVIEQFGRFPHRNEILGRESTAAELEYLAQPGSGF